MKKLLSTLIIFSIAALAPLVSAQTKFRTYANSRYGYAISYPSDLLAPYAKAGDGDTATFTGEGARLVVFGTNRLLNKTLLNEFNAAIDERGAANVAYKIYRKNYFVVSGSGDGKIFYQKMMKNARGKYVAFIIEYDESNRRIYDKIIPRIVKSFK